MKLLLVAIFSCCFAVQSLAMKSRHETFPQKCEDVWAASVAVAKSEQYRIIRSVPVRAPPVAQRIG